MKDIKLSDELPVSAREYFNHFISTPDAKYNYLIAKNHGEVSVGPWSLQSSGKHERVSRFTTNLSNNALVKKLTGSVSLQITETQRYYFASDEELHVESTMEFGGSSLAENFSSEIEWVILTLPFNNNKINNNNIYSSSSNSRSEIKCSVKTEYKGYMFKGLIEKYVHQAACDSFHNWLKAVREKLSLLQEAREYDQHVPTDSASSSSPAPYDDDEDDDDDAEFYDPPEISPSSFNNINNINNNNLPPNIPSSYSSFNYSNPPPSLSSSRPAPPLTATLPTPSHFNSLSPTNFINSTSPNHVIFATYNAGRPRATSPSTTSSLSSSSNAVATASSASASASSFTPLQSYTPSSVRGWESSGEGEKKELEEYRQKFALLVSQTRDREREVDARIARMTQRMDAQARRTRWFLAALAIFSLLWPSVARAIVKFLQWFGPLLRQRMRR